VDIVWLVAAVGFLAASALIVGGIAGLRGED